MAYARMGDAARAVRDAVRGLHGATDRAEVPCAAGERVCELLRSLGLRLRRLEIPDLLHKSWPPQGRGPDQQFWVREVRHRIPGRKLVGFGRRVVDGCKAGGAERSWVEVKVEGDERGPCAVRPLYVRDRVKPDQVVDVVPCNEYGVGEKAPMLLTRRRFPATWR